MEVIFAKVMVGIIANSAEEAYANLCERLAGTSFKTDTFVAYGHDKDGDVIFKDVPEKPIVTASLENWKR